MQYTSISKEICPNVPANETYSFSNRTDCISDNLQRDVEHLFIGIDAFFLIFAGIIVFFMQAGFAMVSSGAVRIKNVQNTLLKNLIDACGAALGFWSIGYALAFGSTDGKSTTFLGRGNFFLHGVDDFAFWFFQYAFASTCTTVVAGTLAERCQMGAYLSYSMTLTGVVYPIIVHAVWDKRGFLSAKNENPLWGTGAIDFAGGGVVHLTAGVTALIAAVILGPRTGRFYDDKGYAIPNPTRIKGHSTSLQILGTFLLWIGWYGFNAGSVYSISSAANAQVASLAVVCTTLAGASGCIFALGCSALKTEMRTGEVIFDVVHALNGCLSGLVSITAGCGVIEPWAAVVVGSVAGLLYIAVSDLLVRWKIDDAVDAVPVHLACGSWSIIAAGVFASPKRLEAAYHRSTHVGWFYSWGRHSADATLLAANVIEILFVVGWVFITMTPFFLTLHYLGWLRSDPMEELIGLDVRYHEVSHFKKKMKDFSSTDYEDHVYIDDMNLSEVGHDSTPSNHEDGKSNTPQVFDDKHDSECI